MAISSRGSHSPGTLLLLRDTPRRAFCHVVNRLGDVSFFLIYPPKFLQSFASEVEFFFVESQNLPRYLGMKLEAKMQKKGDRVGPLKEISKITRNLRKKNSEFTVTKEHSEAVNQWD